MTCFGHLIPHIAFFLQYVWALIVDNSIIETSFPGNETVTVPSIHSLTDHYNIINIFSVWQLTYLSACKNAFCLYSIKMENVPVSTLVLEF